jgi:hypothetical protein
MAKATLLTPKFRGSYVNVFKPRAVNRDDPNSKEKYGITIVLPKTAPSTKAFLAKLSAEFKAAMTEKFGKVLPQEKCKHWPIRDGDEYTDDDGNVRPEFEGAWIIPAKSDNQPGILVMDEDGTKRAAESEREVYSGAWYHASVTVYAWSHKTGGKGVSVSLSGILKVADDDAFGGSRFSENEFDAVEGASNDEAPL